MAQGYPSERLLKKHTLRPKSLDSFLRGLTRIYTPLHTFHDVQHLYGAVAVTYDTALITPFQII